MTAPRSLKLDRGFPVDRPNISVSWQASPDELLALVRADDPKHGGVRKVTDSYFTVGGMALGLETTIGFHFKENGLDQIELFNPNQTDLEAGFERYQAALVQEFGQPTRSKLLGDDFPAHEWKLGPFRILHFMQDRFGPESHLRVLGPGSSFAYDPFDGPIG